MDGTLDFDCYSFVRNTYLDILKRFEIIKGHGPKNHNQPNPTHPPPPLTCSLLKCDLSNCFVHILRGPWLPKVASWKS